MNIYSTEGCHTGLQLDRFNKIIHEATQRIIGREDIIDRFEHWELLDDSPKRLEMLLLSRCRNDDEKKKVKQYMIHYRGE